MMERSDRAYPRYGEGAGDECSRPGSHIGSLSGMPTWAEQPAVEASHETAEEPRQAQWSPRASVVESNGVGEEILNQASPPSGSETSSDQSAAEDTIANVGWVPLRDHAQAGPQQRDGRRSVDDIRPGRSSRRRWVTFVSLSAVIGLVVSLSRRGIRRCD